MSAPTTVAWSAQSSLRLTRGWTLLLLLTIGAMSSAPSAIHAASLSVLSTAAPPFPAVVHPATPSNFFGPRFTASSSSGAGKLSAGAAAVEASSAPPHALPTGRWWQNAVLAAGDQPLVTYPYSVRLSSSGSPLHAEARAAQTTSSRPGSPIDVTATGMYASLPTREENELQVILPWRPDLLITNALYDAAATAPLTGSGANETTSAAAPDAKSIFDSPWNVQEAPIDAARHTVEMEPHQIVNEDLLSVRVQWKQSNGGQMHSNTQFVCNSYEIRMEFVCAYARASDSYR